MSHELGIIGAGNMAEAIARGAIRAGIVQPSQILAADPSPQRLDIFRNQLGIRTVDDNVEVASRSRLLLISVKPQQVPSALKGLGAKMDERTVVISICAGISIHTIESLLGNDIRRRVIRCMPNTPILAGAGMVALARGSGADADDLGGAMNLFRAAAQVVEVTEQQMDAVTAVSGSGPAYFYFLVEQMITAGVQLGLSTEQAHQLAIQTAVGAATMLAESSDLPAELRRKVTSPNGTTHAAITHLESSHWPQITRDAVIAAASRSKELGA